MNNLAKQIEEQIKKVEQLEELADDLRLESESLDITAQQKDHDSKEYKKEAEKEDKKLDDLLAQWKEVNGSKWVYDNEMTEDELKEWERKNEGTKKI